MTVLRLSSRLALPPLDWNGQINQDSDQFAGLVGMYSALTNKATDLSGKGNHGTFVNQTTAGGVNPVTGRHYTFDGTNDKIQIADSASIDNQTLTLAAWVRFDNLGTTRTLIRKGSAAGTDITWLWYWAVAGAISFFATSKEKSVNWTPTVGSWYHLAVTVDASNVYHYRNGINIGGAGVQPTWSDDADPLMVGEWSSFDMNGGIADLRIYNRVLSAPEIARMYDPLTRWELYEHPVRWWVLKPPATGDVGLGRRMVIAQAGGVVAGDALTQTRKMVIAQAGGVVGLDGVIAGRGVAFSAGALRNVPGGVTASRGEHLATSGRAVAGGAVAAGRGDGVSVGGSVVAGSLVLLARREVLAAAGGVAGGSGLGLAGGRGVSVAASSVALAAAGLALLEQTAQAAAAVAGGVVTVERGEGVTAAAAAVRLASVGLGDGRGVSMAASSVALATEIVARQLALTVGAGATGAGAVALQRAVAAQITAIVLAQAAAVLSVELETVETATALRSAVVEFLSEFGITCYIPFGVNYDADLSLDRGEGLSTDAAAQRLANLVLLLTRNQTAAGVAVNAASTALVEALSVAAAGNGATAAGLAAALMLGLSSEASRGVDADVDLSLLHTIGVASRAIVTGWLPLASQRVLTADGVRVVDVGVSLESIFRFWADAGATTAILLHLERMVAQGGTALVGAGSGLIAGRGESVTAYASAGILAGVALAEGRALSVVSRAEGHSVVVVEVAREVAALGRATATAMVAQIVRADLGLDATARAEVGVIFSLLGFLEVDGRVFAAVGLSEDRTLRMRARRSMWRLAIRSRLWRVAADSRRWRLEPRQWLWDVPARSRVWIVSSKN